MSGKDVIEVRHEPALLEREPLIVMAPLVEFLDRANLGRGPLTAAPIGAGHSNVTYALRRGDEQFVLRRPPRGPLPASAHDVLREARLLAALASTEMRVPEVLAVCADATVIGAPFYLMRFIDGHILGASLPPEFASSTGGQAIGDEIVDALVELHAIDTGRPGLASFGRPAGYLQRQLRRFRQLLEINATRPLPELEQVGDWLQDNLPQSPASCVIHGDYRLGNMMFALSTPPRIVAVLDWELAALGDPLADVGYLTATWAEPDDPSDPLLDLSGVTTLHGFPRRSELAKRYELSTGRDLSDLCWYQTLALWKASIFLEGSYKRYLGGTTNDPYFARLRTGVPSLARRALVQATR